ncbi:hypothetical protein [Tabrizicola sp. BL-A-41-H6]|uniref:hypothetical protein n=1 Tax=Tabrizicola sp. BL-A-41-H6 TaxID=3421107 RepID=UPI003D672758
MLNRRNFLAASVMASVAATLPAQAFAPAPLRAQPKHRRIFPKREESGSWLLHSDGPYEPRKVIRGEVIEEVFGAGTYNQLSQRDHWEMIEAGWFSGPDLHLPVPLGDPTYDVWKGYYHPVTEAHDLIRNLFAAKYPGGLSWVQTLPNGVTLGEHPSTPRYATARIRSDIGLLRCVLDVASMGTMVELILPDDLKPLLAEYSDPILMEELMWQIHNRNTPRELPWYEKARRAHEARQRAERAALPPHILKA